MELPRKFAVEKSTAIVQGLRPKWTHAVARFYIAAPLVAQSSAAQCNKCVMGQHCVSWAMNSQMSTNGASAMLDCGQCMAAGG